MWSLRNGGYQSTNRTTRKLSTEVLSERKVLHNRLYLQLASASYVARWLEKKLIFTKEASYPQTNSPILDEYK